VEGLRIELTGKCFYLLLIDDVGPARKALPDLEIIEKCPSSFHYSENLLIEIQADLLQLRPLKPSEKGKWPIVRHHGAPWRKWDDQRDIRLPGQSCLAYDPPRLLHAPLPRERSVRLTVGLSFPSSASWQR
jgi:hypothetical protein